MCGRYGFVPGKNFYDRFDIENRLENLTAKYNISPGQMVPVIVQRSPNQALLMKWGLIPYWAKDPKIGYKMINARAETLYQKPSFKKPLKYQRCLIPTSGFYEWKKLNGEKTPFYVHLKNTNIFAFAGLYDIWKDAQGYPLKTFTIITTSPSSLLASIHYRMPAILPEEVENKWLDKNIRDEYEVLDLLKPYEGELEAYPVSKAVNNPANDSEDLIKPEVKND